MEFNLLVRQHKPQSSFFCSRIVDSMSAVEDNPVHGLISGASAGVVSSIICAPLDITKVCVDHLFSLPHQHLKSH